MALLIKEQRVRLPLLSSPCHNVVFLIKHDKESLIRRLWRVLERFTRLIYRLWGNVESDFLLTPSPGELLCPALMEGGLGGGGGGLRFFFFFFSFKVGQCLVAVGYSRLCACQGKEELTWEMQGSALVTEDQLYVTDCS